MNIPRSTRIAFLCLAAFLFSTNWFIAVACTVSVKPSNATLYGGQTQQFTASVDEPGKEAVTWSISPSVGTISSTGLYTAPATISKQQTVIVTATNKVETDKFASATVTLKPKATPVITWATPAPITYGTPLSSTQLDATANVPGSFVYTPAAGTELASGSHILSVTFTPTNTAEYNTATDSVTLTVNNPPVSVTVTPATATLYAGQTQQFTSSVSNNDGSRCGKDRVTWTISPSVGTISSTGLYTAPVTISKQQTVTVTATSQANPTKSASATITLMPKTTPVITWATPAAIKYGAALSATQLDATASVPGTFVYTPAAGTVLSAGSHTLSVTFTPTNTVDYNTATDSVSLTVSQAALTITASSPTVSYGAPVPTITPLYSGWVNG